MRNIHTLCLFSMMTAAFPSLSESLPSQPKKVIISGAGGQTGKILFRKILDISDQFEAIGLVRSEESKEALIEFSGAPSSSIKVVDVTNAEAVKEVTKGCNALCICSSATPKPTGDVDGTTGRPIFGFPNGSPEEVDWHGQKNQIDACGPGVHIVCCSSRGGTDPNHVLNKIGKKTNSDGISSGGDILKWKRKAEVYLIESGKPYTIVHPGGLINETGGERELILNVDDSMEGSTSHSVPREDVAEIMLQSLLNPDLYGNRSFDLRAKLPGEGHPTTDFRALIGTLKGKNCDYSLGEIA